MLTRPFVIALIAALLLHGLLLAINLKPREGTPPPIEVSLIAPPGETTQLATAPEPVLAAVDSPMPPAPPRVDPTPAQAPMIEAVSPPPEPPREEDEEPAPEAAPAEAPTATPEPAPEAEPRPAPRPAEPPARPAEESEPPPVLNLRGQVTRQAAREQELRTEMFAASQRMEAADRVLRMSSRSHPRHTPEGAYLAAWRQKVERVGNLNYPSEAARRNLAGRLVLEVVVLPDGQVERITVVRSSGQPVLDEGARRIVELSSPFSPFPEALAEKYDRMVITRTWAFSSGNRLQTD